MCTALYSAIFIRHHFFFTSLHSLPNYHCNEHTAGHPAAWVPVPSLCQHAVGTRGRPLLLAISRSCSAVPAPYVHVLLLFSGACPHHAASLPLGAVTGRHILSGTVHGDHESSYFRCYLLDRPLPITTTTCGARLPGPPWAVHLVSIISGSSALQMGRGAPRGLARRPRPHSHARPSREWVSGL